MFLAPLILSVASLTTCPHFLPPPSLFVSVFKTLPLHFLKFYHPSNIPLPEGRAFNAWEPLKPKKCLSPLLKYSAPTTTHLIFCLCLSLPASLRVERRKKKKTNCWAKYWSWRKKQQQQLIVQIGVYIICVLRYFRAVNSRRNYVWVDILGKSSRRCRIILKCMLSKNGPVAGSWGHLIERPSFSTKFKMGPDCDSWTRRRNLRTTLSESNSFHRHRL
jgi:hypothetical protein